MKHPARDLRKFVRAGNDIGSRVVTEECLVAKRLRDAGVTVYVIDNVEDGKRMIDAETP